MLDFLIIVSKDKRPLSDDILTQFINCKVDGVTFEYETAQWALSERRDRFVLFCTNGAPEKHISAKRESIRFFGGMIFQGDCITDIRNLSPILGNNADHSDVFGRYIYGELKDEEQSHIHRDVLGCEPLFVGFGAELSAISNVPGLAAQAVHGKNYKNSKNIMAIAQIIACGGAVNDLQTSFNNVFSCPQNTGIQIDRQNNVQFYSLIENMYYKMHQQEWDIQFGKARQDCLDFLAKANIVSGNITGGFDSRVALALAIEAGIYKNIQFSVIGYADHPDVVIAKQIAKHYGLKLEHKETVITNVDNNLLDRIYDVALKRQYKQAGMRAFSEDLANAAYGIGPQRKKINNINKYSCSLAGTALEFFRGYLSLHKLLMNNYQNKIMGSQDREFLIQDTVEKRLLSQAAYNFFHRRLESHFKSYEDLYSYDLRFTQARMPQFHAGLNNTAFSFGMHPLLHRLAMIQAPELRAAGAIHFKLIESCASDLLYFPFANKKWHYFVYAGTKYETKIKQVAPFANVAKRSFPSSTNSLKYVEHWFSKNLELNDSVWNTYDRKWLIASIGNAKDMVCGKKYVNNGILSKLLDVIGNSLFLDNQEISCVQNNISQKIPLNFPDIPLKKNIYSPLQTYVCSAQEICLAGQLLFSKNKIFRAVDHMELTAEQKKLFSNAVAANKSIPRFLGKIICCFIPKQRNRHHFMQKHVKDK